MLKEITSAPLKPYQRLEVVRDFLVPKLQHELVLGCAHRNTIARIDRMIRGSIRTWLRLPKNTSLGFLHAPVKSGGLVMPSLGTTLPLLQKKRFEKLLSCQTSTERTLVKLPSFQTTLRRVNLPCKVGKETVCSPQEGNEDWTRVLLSSAGWKVVDNGRYRSRKLPLDQKTTLSLYQTAPQRNPAMWRNTLY